MNKDIKIVVLAGASGSGKNSIIQNIISVEDKFEKLTTATTRNIREGEKDGLDYYFLSEKEFDDKLEGGQILEQNTHAGKRYGTYKHDLEKKSKKGKIILAQVQKVGAEFFKNNFNSISFFIKNPDLENLESRIRGRGEIPENEIQKRLEIAKRENSSDAEFYDYAVENADGKMNEAVREILNILKKTNFL